MKILLNILLSFIVFVFSTMEVNGAKLSLNSLLLSDAVLQDK